MAADELSDVADALRERIVDVISRVGGHFAPGLGVVELTLALHRVFESPKDMLLWDTGHQAYVHKILTGRRDAFPSHRKSGGLSGYPSRAESPHDWIENSHASTVLSYAHGLATAQQADGGEGRRVIAIIGDGSMTGGYSNLIVGHGVRRRELRGPVDLEEQRRAYQAFVEAWRGVDALGGVFFWIWDGAGGAGAPGKRPLADARGDAYCVGDHARGTPSHRPKCPGSERFRHCCAPRA